MMKRCIAYVLSALLFLSVPSYVRAEDDGEDTIQEVLGVASSDSMDAAIGISMMGWGIAIIIGITILALVLHQSTGTSHGDSTGNGSGSGSGSGSSGGSSSGSGTGT